MADPERTRIAHVLTSIEIGGAEQLVLRLLSRLPADRFDARVICLRRAGDLAGAFANAGVDVEVLRGPESLGAVGLAGRLAESLRRRPARLVHTHNASPFLIGAVARRIARSPRHVHTKHGLGGAQTWLGHRAMTWASARVDAIVAVSEETRRAGAIDDRMPAEKITVIPNGVDVTAFQRSTVYRGDGPCRAITVGRLEPVKGHIHLIEALPLIRARCPAFELLVVGDGSERNALATRAAALGVRDAVTFAGTRHDIPALLAQSNLFVLPSLSEGVSLTLLEAMASALPVVATAVGGTPEVVRSGEEALLVPPADAQALAAAIVRLATSEPLASRLASTTRRRVETTFSLDVMVMRYAALYDVVLDGAAK